MIGWLLLGTAIVAEVLGTTALRFSGGFTKLWPSMAVVVAYGFSIWLLALTLKHVSLGVTYAVWSGVGTALVACVGFVFLDESVTFIKIASIFVIVAGVGGLYLSEGTA